MGGYCDYTVFTPAIFPLVPPCDKQLCPLSIAFAPNDEKSSQYMSAIEHYYGMTKQGFESEDKMLKFLAVQNLSLIHI